MMKHVTICVTGGIAAYKSCELVRLFVKAGVEVQVLMTESSEKFVTALTFQSLSGNPVYSNLFDAGMEEKIGHIQLADETDLILVAPATANSLAKAANGMADDLVSTVLLATKKPIFWAPSMNVNMWENPATQNNVGKLRDWGHRVLDPGEGDMACGWVGKGRMLEPDQIFAVIQEQFR